MEQQIELAELERSDGRTPAWRTPWVVLGALTVFALLLGGAYLATADDAPATTEVATEDDRTDLTSSAEESQEEPAEEPADGDAGDDSSSSTVETDFGDEESALAEEADGEFYEGDGPVVFDGSRFVAIGYDRAGPTLRSSADGVSWTERPFPELPSRGNVHHLAAHDGTVAVIIEEWPEPTGGEDELAEIFGDPTPPTRHLAWTTDLENWTSSELSISAPSSEPSYTGISGLALGDAGVVVLGQSQPMGIDEVRLLVEAEILDRTDLDRYCGIGTEDPARFDVRLCDHEAEEAFWVEFEEAMEAAETDEERREIERAFDEAYIETTPEVIATIEPGDPLFEPLRTLYSGDFESYPTNIALHGPVGGPFAQTTIDGDGYLVNIVYVDGSYVSMLQRWDRNTGRSSARTLTSTDGSTWTSTGDLPDGDFGELVAVGSNLLVVGGGEDGGPRLSVSSDLGATWEPSDFQTELFGVYPHVVSGQAGAAAVVQGSTEPYPDFEGPDAVVVRKDGYELTTSFVDQGRVTLVAPDGSLVVDLEQEAFYDGSASDVVRFGRLSGSQTFLDPETGADLVTFTNDDFEAAYREIEEPELPEIEQRLELYFSSDGRTWTVLDDGRLDTDPSEAGLQLLAVGDDAVIVARRTWNNPPEELLAFEFEGREPTDDENRALEEWFEVNGGGGDVEYLRIDI